MSVLASLYQSFRQEIDSYCANLIVDNLDTRPVIYKDKVIGLLILDDDYVDSFYIHPDYRRKGIGEDYIKEQYRKDKCRWHDLRIVNGNYPAAMFWNKVFNLRIIDYNFCDIHYEILGLKEPGYDT